MLANTLFFCSQDSHSDLMSQSHNVTEEARMHRTVVGQRNKAFACAQAETYDERIRRKCQLVFVRACLNVGKQKKKILEYNTKKKSHTNTKLCLVKFRLPFRFGCLRATEENWSAASLCVVQEPEHLASENR